MSWNWQQPNWPAFHFDPESIIQQEKQFLLSVGSSSAFLKKVNEEERSQFVIEMLSSEGEESFRIEGEILDRASLQSSIKKHFGLAAPIKLKQKKEEGAAELLCGAYESYAKPLTHEMLWEWHAKLFKGLSVDISFGKYREHEEPMQIVGARLDSLQVFFEAPPSQRVLVEMDRYIDWFNHSKNSASILARAAIAHLYFEMIHPFENGNGRIGRALVEKTLSQEVGRPILITASKILERRKKEYYLALEKSNKTLEVTEWVVFFANVILEAQKESLHLLHFLIEKSKLLLKLSGHLNSRQEKVLIRMFREGPDGFQGGLSAEKYIVITNASRATATRDLSELVELGALFKTGELRHTRYWLKLRPFDQS